MADLNNPSAWGSWLLAMHEVFPRLVPPPRTFLDHGSGEFSTAWALSKDFDRIDSTDISEEWLHKTRAADSRLRQHHTPSTRPYDLHPRPGNPDAETLWLMRNPDLLWDLALIDGRDRVNSLNLLMQNRRAKVILVHDFEANSLCYHWDGIRLPASWDYIRYDSVHPQTGIFACSETISLLREA